MTPNRASVGGANAKVSLRDFEGERFDRARWINEQTRGMTSEGGGEGEGAMRRGCERFLGELELQLQLTGEDLSMSLEDRSREGVARVPRAMSEIEVVEERVRSLYAGVREILSRLDRVEDESRTSVEALRQLDAAKQRMESARETLQEANGLADLMSSIDGIFASGNIRNMSESLARIKRGLAVVGDVPEFADGQDKVDAFEHKLEGVVRPALIMALESQNGTAARELRDVLRATGRGTALESTYADTRVTSRVMKQWKTLEREASTVSDEVNADSDVSVRMVENFLKYCATTLQDEASWCSTTFPEDAASLIPVSWCSLHTTLEPAITEKLSSMSVEQLVPVRHAFETYVEDVGSTFAKLVGVGSSNDNSDAIHGAMNDAMMAVAEPFMSIEQRYGEFALANMKNELEALVNIPEATSISTSDDLSSVVHKMLATLPKAIGICAAAMERCEQVTAGLEITTCIHAIESAMEHYVDLISLVLRDLRKAASLIDSTAAKLDPSVTSTGEEFIRGSLSLLDIINAIPTAVFDFESALKASILQLRSTLRPALAAASGLNEGVKESTLVSLSIAAHVSRSRKLAVFLDKVADSAATHSLDGTIIPVGAEHMNALLRTVEKFIYDALLGRVSLELKGIASSDVWSAKPAESAYKLPTFSAYPQERMTNAGEYLLSLPQHLDGINDDDLARTSSLATSEESAAQDVATSEDWIAKIAEASADLVLKEVQSISSLSDQGAAQLSADLEYFSNIVAALSLTPPSALLAWYKCVGASRDEYDEFARTAAAEGIDARIVKAAAATRGIQLRSTIDA